MLKNIFAFLVGAVTAILPSPSFAQTSPAAGAASCSIHFWPAGNMRAAVESLVGGGLIDSLAGVGPLPEATEALRSSLDPNSQFEILKSLDFAPVIHDAKPVFFLEPELIKPMSLKKKSAPLTKPETSCYMEIIMTGTVIDAHMIYGVSLNSGLIVRVYRSAPMPVLAVLSGAGTKIDKGKSKIRHSAAEMVGDLKLAFRHNLEQVLGYVAANKAIALQ